MSELLETEFGEIAEEVLTDCAPVLQDSMKKSLSATVQHEGESELVSSITPGKPKATKTDAWIVNVTPKGNSGHMYTAHGKGGKPTKRKYPVSNALKAIWLEYGVAGRQPARPWLAKAINDAREEVMDRAQKVYNRMVGADES